jgi:WD40 repeat protein/Ca2+-binding EF-hand superfamily protein
MEASGAAAASASDALSLSWIFGFSREVPLHNLCDENRQAIFYVSAHTGVIYDLNAKSQRLLQGHCNAITCTCATADRRKVATADTGADSMLVVWDSYTALPVKTIATPHPEGVQAMDLSPDGRYLVTLSQDASPQVLSVWDCSPEGTSDAPLLSAQITGAGGDAAEMQTSVRFDPADPTSIVTNGASVVVFWSFADGVLTYYSPPLGEHDFKQPIGVLTQTCFIPDSTRAVTATVDGDAILWDCVEQGPGESTSERRASKVVRLHTGAVSCLLTAGEYLVSGGADGFIRFFDFDFRIIAWFEDLDAGPVASVSFAVPSSQAKKSSNSAVLACPDFIIGTTNALIVSCTPAMFDELDAPKRRGTLIVQGQDSMVHGLAAHPSLSRFAVTGRAGLLQLWDYSEKRLLLMRMFDKLLGHTLVFSPNGKFLAIGFTSGVLKVLMGMTLEEVCTFKASKGCITAAAFSSDSTFLATADTDNCIGVYRLGNPGDEVGAKKEWVYIGKYRGHYKPVTGLQFGEGADGSPRLFSTGEDRALVEYDLARSSVQGGVQLRNTAKVEQTAVPTGCMWVPAGVQGADAAVVTASDQYKMRIVAPGPKSIQRTVVGPTYGGPLTRMLLVPVEGDDASGSSGSRHAVYATHDKVIGLMQLPLDGNPSKVMGLIAHPGEVSDIAVSWDGKCVITAGGADNSIHLWRVEVGALDAAAAEGGTGIAPFVSQLEGGAEGSFYQEIVDHFYYAQLRAQGEDTTEPRRITGEVPISQLGNMMRSLGFYPSQREVDELTQEARLCATARESGSNDALAFDEFLVMYINHRPIFGVSKEQITAAFATISTDGSGTLARESLLRALASHDESLAGDDLEQCLRMLTGVDDPALAIGDKVDAKTFAEQVLGFQDYTAASA